MVFTSSNVIVYQHVWQGIESQALIWDSGETLTVLLNSLPVKTRWEQG